MIRKQTLQIRLVFISIVLVIFILAGCAVEKRTYWRDPKTALALQYWMPENQVLKYQTSAKQTQIIEVMGQSVEVETEKTIEFSVKSKGLKENNLLLEVTIDSMSIKITSPQGDLSPDQSTVIGKSFDMTLSILGKEMDLSGADSIKYDLGPGDKRSISADFQALFPNLAGRPVKIGDTWTTKDTITEKSDNGEVRINLESVNTLEGFETVNGLECVKITAEVTGTLGGEGYEQGMDLTFKGEIKGTDTWYFAYMKGIFVKMITDVSTEGTITTSGAQSMTIPMTQEMKIEVKLIK